MEIKFFSKGKVLDLSGQKISVSEKNSKVSDQVFTKYLFPFEIYMDEEFKEAFGDYASFDSFELAKIIEGQLLYENVYRLAKLEIISTEGDYLTGQIDFGFEEVPNFDKPLKELPLEKFDVPDIHTFAAETSKKKYPETNFNFPRLYYGKFSPDDKVWDAYNGFVNDLNDAGTEMRRNYITDDGEVYNQNIIHPLPYFLYVLKVGFKDAGYLLAGDILTDPFLTQQCIFSGTEYFSRLTQKRYGLSVDVNDYESNVFGTSRYLKTLDIPKKGKYSIIGFFNQRKVKGSNIGAIFLNNNLIWSYSSGSYDENLVNFNINLTTQIDNSVLVFYLIRVYDMTSVPVIKVDLIGDELSSSELEGEDNGVITNRNEIDLARAVPEITFGEFVNRIRNFLNYGLTSEGNTIFMNKIGNSEPTNIKVLPEKFLALKPRRNLLNKKSFVIRMPNWENDEKADSVYYDSTGLTLNKEAEETTTVIETNTYVLPVYIAKPRGPETGVVKSYDTSLLQLVKYYGRTENQNNAQPSPELTFPTLFYTNWEPWLRGRLRSSEFVWSFTAEEDELSIVMDDFIGCYQNIHIIKEWVKDYSDKTIEVNIVTETVN